MFSPADLDQLTRHSITIEQVNRQLEIFRNGIPFMKLVRPATLEDGIIQISATEGERLTTLYSTADTVSLLKFIPASGAASRMFKSLFEFIENDHNKDFSSNPVIANFIHNLSSFAFYDELRTVAGKRGETLEALLAKKNYIEVVKLLVDKEGLNYGFLPKGLLKFHRYQTTARTPFEEHLVEAAQYASSPGQPVRLHFTVSPEHQEAFHQLLQHVRGIFEKRFRITYDVSFSVQKPSSDTIAVDLNNIPFRDSDGKLIFRPAGHGALIDNLNEMDADVIFIKNIDNVVPEKKLETVVQYKKILAGKLLEIREHVFTILREFDRSEPSIARLQVIRDFILRQLHYEFVSPLDETNNKLLIKIFRQVLNRPIRVCGVVKNLGEPGGGPFWAPNSRGDISLQIIESSQVDPSDSNQVSIFKRATHFNPVDLVCSIRSYTGEKFHLPDFVDRNTGFISQKSKDGKGLKALELPGLWNGAMSDWITLFVEVPVETFNPVKTINDLLRPEHQQ
jgi:hypothetical protein